MKKVILHPLSIIVMVILVILNKIDLVIISLIFITLHEYVHYLVAKAFGYHLNKMYLMPYGGVIVGEEQWQNTDAFFIAVAGPIFNISITIIVVALWWVFPSSYTLTKDIARINLVLAITNLLPFYPLDGARMILSLSRNKIKTLKVLKILGIIGSSILIILFIVSFFYKINITLGIMGITLLAGALYQSKNATLIQAVNNIDILKNYSRAIPRKELLIYINSTLSKLLKSIDDKHIFTVEFVDGYGKTVCILENEDLTRLCSYPNKKERLSKILGLS